MTGTPPMPMTPTIHYSYDGRYDALRSRRRGLAVVVIVSAMMTRASRQNVPPCPRLTAASFLKPRQALFRSGRLVQAVASRGERPSRENCVRSILSLTSRHGSIAEDRRQALLMTDADAALS